MSKALIDSLFFNREKQDKLNVTQNLKVEIPSSETLSHTNTSNNNNLSGFSLTPFWQSGVTTTTPQPQKEDNKVSDKISGKQLDL